MPTPGAPHPADLNIDLAVRDGKTMTVHHARLDGTLQFMNTENAPLVITSSSEYPPFIEDGCSDAVAEITVPPQSGKTVRLSGRYGLNSSFTYSARIGDSEPEDPIIIIDRR